MNKLTNVWDLVRSVYWITLFLFIPGTGALAQTQDFQIHVLLDSLPYGLTVSGFVKEPGTSNLFFSTDSGIFKLHQKQLVRIDSFVDDHYGRKGIGGPKIDFNTRFEDLITFHHSVFATSRPRDSFNPEAKSDGGQTYTETGRGGLYRVGNHCLIIDNSHTPSIMSGEVLCNCQNRLWMSSEDYGMLFQYSGLGKDGFDTVKYDRTDYIASMTCSPRQELFIDFVNAGIGRISSAGKFTLYSADTIPRLQANAGSYGIIRTDREGNVWLAYDAGLVEFDGTYWISLPYTNDIGHDGFPADYLHFVLDTLDRKWVSGSSSLLMFDGNKWNNMTGMLKLKPGGAAYLGICDGKIIMQEMHGRLLEILIK